MHPFTSISIFECIEISTAVTASFYFYLKLVLPVMYGMKLCPHAARARQKKASNNGTVSGFVSCITRT